MRTVEERAQDFVSNGEYSPTLKECYIAGAAEEHLLLTHWNNIEEDKDGFTTNKAYAEIVASVPILVKDIVFGEMFVIDKNNMAEWGGELQHHPNQYKWRKIHE
jgi:hypothetical protein